MEAGLVTSQHINEGRIRQISHASYLFGRRALDWRMITPEQLFEILEQQSREEYRDSFADVAKSLGYLSEEQIRAIKRGLPKSQLLLDEALLSMGVVTRRQLRDAQAKFRRVERALWV